MIYVKAVTHHGTFFGEVIEEQDDFVRIRGYKDGLETVSEFTFYRKEYNKLIIPTWKYITESHYDILFKYNKNF